MKEISCRVVQGVFTVCPKHGIMPQQIFEGVNIPLEYLKNPRNRIDWSVWARVCHNIALHCRDRAQYVGLAREWAMDGQGTMFRRAAWVFASPEKAYGYFAGNIIPSTYRHLKAECRRESEHALLFSLTIPAEYEGCAEFFVTAEGVLAMVPTFIGLTPAHVDSLMLSTHEGIYRIRPPASRTLWSQAGRVGRWVRAGFDSRHLLRERNEEIERSYAELERQAKEFRGVLEASGEAMAVVRDGRILYANPALAALLRVPAASNLVGTTTDRWLSAGELERLRRWGAEAGAPDARTEARLKLSAQDDVLAEFSPPRPIVWADEPAMLWQIADVTERRALEQAIAEAGHREQQRIAHDLHDGLGQILTGAAFKARALENMLGKEASGHAGAAAELVALINEATGQARDLAHGLAPLDETAQSLGPALRHFAATTARLFSLRCDYVQSGGEPPLPPRAGVQLYRVVQEAVTNAIRHGKARVIEIGLTHHSPRLELSVSDDGLGLPPDFDSRRDAGMGLRIMRHRLESLGGTLTVNRRDDGRSGTRVVLSAATQSGTVTPVKTLLPSDVALRSSTGGMRKVLLVDDHPVVRAGLRQLLSQENDLDVCGEAGTAVEALTRCAGHPPDIVLIDMLLDESGNSLELIRELRARHPALRIVVLSMYAEEIYATAARQAGADAYVMKQAKPEVLLEALRS